MKTAYPNTREPVSITLYRNIPFDNTYKHHSMISNLFTYDGTGIYTGGSGAGLPCERFLNMRDTLHNYIFPRTQKPSEVYNFEYGNGLITKLTLELTAEETNSNYLKVVCGNDVYYYFITAISQKNYETYELTLEIDVLMTYQDEFLDGMRDVPVFTQRKHSHRFSNNGLIYHCADYKNGESIFAGVKPNIVLSHKDLTYGNSEMNKLYGINWLYVCIDAKTSDEYAKPLLYEMKKHKFPIYMIAIPLNVNKLTYKKSDGTYELSYTRTEIENAIKLLVSDNLIHGCKISPYPPFTLDNNSNATIQLVGDRELTISCDDVDVISETYSAKEYKMNIGESELFYCKVLQDIDNTWKKALTYGFAVVSVENNGSHKHNKLKYSDFNLTNASEPTINDARYDEPKLKFAPFRKYYLNSQYATQGYEFHLELYCSNYGWETDNDIIGFTTYTTAYIGDNNIYTEINEVSGETIFAHYKYEKLGLACSINYNMPCGQNALDVFNTTQHQSFYTSKVASGITSGLTIAGGVASIVIGAGMTAGSAGTLTPAGMAMMAGGMAGIASGTAGVANTIKSSISKVEDLKNTADSINISGSSFISDLNTLGTTYGLPYVSIYECDVLTKRNANDFFYQYGYETARECYFNTDLYFDNVGGVIDNNLFGRTIFNYIQIREDITNKINADIPMIVKKKLSSIFNEGITIWNFFGFDYLWGIFLYESVGKVHTKWFMKNELDNTEYKQ